jgi:hypothetical protein
VVHLDRAITGTRSFTATSLRLPEVTA